MKEPWFRVVEVVELRGRSMADIAAEVAREHRVSLQEMRSARKAAPVIRARHEAVRRIKAERFDVVSEQVARYFRCEGSTVRRVWRSIAA